ncbi:uncharacterized protein LOC129047038 [Molothrus ater]|uniref:uncharacterized protein LOC129047038 n=1 Tax=Molothrus ater TaxID=84834 RepID=UPI0023E775B9|nr:uncharacterized protein LOC129047038 [Molothrus ater]
MRGEDRQGQSRGSASFPACIYLRDTASRGCADVAGQQRSTAPPGRPAAFCDCGSAADVRVRRRRCCRPRAAPAAPAASPGGPAARPCGDSVLHVRVRGCPGAGGSSRGASCIQRDFLPEFFGLSRGCPYGGSWDRGRGRQPVLPWRRHGPTAGCGRSPAACFQDQHSWRVGGCLVRGFPLGDANLSAAPRAPQRRGEEAEGTAGSEHRLSAVGKGHPQTRDEVSRDSFCLPIAGMPR